MHRYCFHLIHLDLPYNPNRLEQRNGRIDRYGQRHDPEIMYLYIPGTFEESLLLHLIAKYEKARSVLDVMPNTLGVTADLDDATLSSRLSEDPGDLFQADATKIRSLDRAMADNSPQIVGELMREIDRAFDAFDLMAVNHGWYGMRAADSGMENLVQNEKQPLFATYADDLPDFIAAVAEAGTTGAAISGNTIRLPDKWMHGLDGLPGVDASRKIIRFTRDRDIWHDGSGNGVAFLGRAHPLVLRAIRQGQSLGGAVAVGQGDDCALVLTHEIKLAVANRTMFRRIAAIMAWPNRTPADVTHCLPSEMSDFVSFPADRVWDRWFVNWADQARLGAAVLLEEIASRCQRDFLEWHAAGARESAARSHRWLTVKADLLCGVFVPPTRDLFGGPEPGPAWRYQADPFGRLVSLATDPQTSATKRREANDALDVFRRIEMSAAAEIAITTRPIGMLMLVPRDAIRL